MASWVSHMWTYTKAVIRVQIQRRSRREDRNTKHFAVAQLTCILHVCIMMIPMYDPIQTYQYQSIQSCVHLIHRDLVSHHASTLGAVSS